MGRALEGAACVERRHLQLEGIVIAKRQIHVRIASYLDEHGHENPPQRTGESWSCPLSSTSDMEAAKLWRECGRVRGDSMAGDEAIVDAAALSWSRNVRCASPSANRFSLTARGRLAGCSGRSLLVKQPKCCFARHNRSYLCFLDRRNRQRPRILAGAGGQRPTLPSCYLLPIPISVRTR